MYIIKIESGEYRGKRFYLYTNKNNILKYGDLIEINGEYIIPSKARNYKGFDYREYLKTKKIYGSIKTENNQIRIIERNKLNPILMFSNKVRSYIVDASNKLVSQRTSGLLAGILLGDKSGISEETIENFKISNLSHMLSVSGAHASYIILGITFVLSKSKVSKKWIYILTIFILILFMFITNFTASVTRACFMAIIVLGANLLYRKPDIWTSISIALLAILIANPFTVNEIGLQLSFLGTIGIILFNKNIEKFLNRIKINSKISKLLSVTISAQIMIMPVMAYKFNTISLTFFISNILASPFLGINIILGFITIFISFILFDLAKILAVVLDFGLKILIFISEFTAKLPLSSILIKTPYAFIIILIYCLVLTLNYIYSIYNLNRSLRLFQKHLLKKLNKRNIENVLAISICVMIIFNFFSFTYSLIPKDLKIYFIDVGQGDSTLIITPQGKSILIDGGGSESYDIGKNILLPYLLDRKVTKLDYVIISHFDTDHVWGILTVIEELDVKKVIIGKQYEICDNYKEFLKIIRQKDILVKQVQKGDKINIEKNVQIKVLFPEEKMIEENSLNNNSLVFKLMHKDFSVFFTGDIEKIAEERIVKLYSKSEILKSTILKVAHHGSKTSSIQEFLELVQPKIALIGVGKNNLYGHPNQEVIERIKKIGAKIYRTDNDGEIIIEVNKRIKIQKMLN